MRIAAALLCVVSVAGAAAASVTITDDRQVAHTFATPPARIVSLLPSITESVCALEACDRLVGTDRYSDAPASVHALPKLGGLDDAQIERIAALRPDVVLAGRSARVADRLEALGLPVVLLDAETHADVHRTLTLIAHMLGTPSQADRVWSDIERDIATAAARIPSAIRGRTVYFEVESAPYAASAGSFIGETLTRLGMRNIVPADLGPFPRLNPEFVVRGNPDVVIAAQRDVVEMRGRPGWSRLDALAHGRVCGFDPAHYDVLVRPGPRLGEAARELADCLAALPGA